MHVSIPSQGHNFSGGGELVRRVAGNKSDEESFVNESFLGEILAAKTVASTLHNYLHKHNQSIQSVIFLVAKVAAATARTTKSITITVRHLGRTDSTGIAGLTTVLVVPWEGPSRRHGGAPTNCQFFLPRSLDF